MWTTGGVSCDMMGLQQRGQLILEDPSWTLAGVSKVVAPADNQ